MGKLGRFGLFDSSPSQEPVINIKSEPSSAEESSHSYAPAAIANRSTYRSGGSLPSETSQPVRVRAHHAGNGSSFSIPDLTADTSSRSGGFSPTKRLRSWSPPTPTSLLPPPLPSVRTSVPASRSTNGIHEAPVHKAHKAHKAQAKDSVSSRTEPVDEDSSGTESDKIESVIDTIMANTTDNFQARIDRLQGVYDRNRRRHRKYRRLAEMASNEMHNATKAIFQILEAQSKASVDGPPGNLRRPLSHNLQSSSHKDPAKRSSGYDEQQKDKTRPWDAPKSARLADPLDHVMPETASRSSRNRAPSSTASRSHQPDGDNEMQLNSKAARPYQFNTRLLTAFKRKPREAFACTLPGMQQQAVVAYGLDGTVQFWSPREQSRTKLFEVDYFETEYVQQIAQISPSVFALIPKASRTGPSDTPKSEPMFLGIAESCRSNRINALPVQRWQDIPSGGASRDPDQSVTVIQGMAFESKSSSDGYENAFMLSGTAAQRTVLLQSLRVEHGKVTRVNDTLTMECELRSRVSALCHESQRNFVVAASATGRIFVNDAQSGRLVSECSYQSCVIGSISPSPANGNLLMMSCGSNSDQLRIFDLRQTGVKKKPVLCLGRNTARTQSEYIRPAWHPSGGLVFCPSHRDQDGAASDNVVAIWDTRYAKCDIETPQIFRPHKSVTWSVAFVDSDKSAGPLMVTTGGDHNIGFTSFQV